MLIHRRTVAYLASVEPGERFCPQCAYLALHTTRVSWTVYRVVMRLSYLAATLCAANRIFKTRKRV